MAAIPVGFPHLARMRSIAVALWLCALGADAQIDSLLRVRDALPRDTSRLPALTEIIKTLGFTDPDSALGFVEEFRAIAEKGGTTLQKAKLSALKRSQHEGEYKHRSELVTLYINEHPEIFKKNILQIEKKWQRPDYRLTIDLPEDLILCRKIIRHFNGHDKYIPYKELISYLDKNPQLRNLVHNITDENYIKPYH